MIQIPIPLVEYILLGPEDDRRQLQDSPILGDVWIEFGKNPDKRLDLLIAPYRGEHPGDVAAAIDEGLSEREADEAGIAFLQGVVVARLTFEEVMRVVAPKTKWWIVRRAEELSKYNQDKMKATITKILEAAKKWHAKKAESQELLAVERFLTLTALILWAGSHDPQTTSATKSTEEQISLVLTRAESSVDDIVKQLSDLAKKMWLDATVDPIVWQVSRNRAAMPSISRSVPAVKADAATTLFKVNCSE
ncbi:MAG TPA: hypothetical protein VF074_19785, partial [Pyrinomonadaceae bacterium]